MTRHAVLLLLILLAVVAITLRASGFHATARCADGSYSWSAHHRGACSWHGGVVQWYR